MNIEERKNQIAFLIKKYYDANDFLKGKSYEKFLNKAYEKFLYSNLTIEDVEKEIIKAIERKKNTIQNPTIIKQTEIPTLRSNNENDDQTNALHNSGYASSLAISTMTLITFISILIIYVLFCILF